LLLLYWPFGKDTRSNFQYPELESNLDGPDFHDLGAGGTKGDAPSSDSSSLRQQNLRCARPESKPELERFAVGYVAIPQAVNDAEFDTHQSDDELA
jgi:hypothetical protein